MTSLRLAQTSPKWAVLKRRDIKCGNEFIDRNQYIKSRIVGFVVQNWLTLPPSEKCKKVTLYELKQTNKKHFLFFFQPSHKS